MMLKKEITIEDQLFRAKLARRVFEMNREDIVENFFYGRHCELKEELDPKEIPLPYRFYANPEYIIISLLKQRQEQVFKEVHRQYEKKYKSVIIAESAL